ncbi:MAG: carboxypeptidase-like regulatory domain-containing protein [Candidatus Neomarinimicrobiota bacterium]
MKKIISILFLTGFSGIGWAAGIITGNVTDELSGEPVIGANIIIEGTDLGAATDINGGFIISAVPAGTYSVRSSVIGYKPQILTDIVVNSIRPAVINFSIESVLIELNQVNVTADYFTRRVDAPISTQTQSVEEIRRLPGGLEDVVRAISILPGVAQAQSGRNDLIVRGGAPSENLFVIDGIEVPNINHFGTQGASGGPLSFINLDFVANTSFSTGGYGAAFGDRLSSVLEIDLRDGRTDHPGGKGTISATQFGLNLEGPLSETGKILFSARRSYLDLIFKAAGFGFVPEYWDFLGKVSYQLNTTDQLSFLTVAALDNVKWFNDTSEQRYSNSRVLGSDQTQLVAGATYKRVFTRGFATISLSQVNVDFDFLQSDSLLNPIFSNNSHEYETAIKSDVVYRVSDNTRWSFGGRIKRIDFNSNLLVNQDQFGTGTSVELAADYQTVGIKSAGYTQITRRFENLDLTFGLRADDFNLIAQGIVWSPRISAKIKINDRLDLIAGGGRYHQAPAYIWLVAYEQNRQLRQVRADQLIVGLDYRWRTDTKISLESYWKIYNDYPTSSLRPYLVMANTGAGFGGSDDGFAAFGIDPLISRGSGYSRGAEFFIQKKLSEIPCYGTVSISYNQTEFKALDGISRPGSYDQTWIVNLGGGYIFNKNWEFSTKFRYATGRPYTPFDQNGQLIVDRYNGLRIDDNHSLDLRLDRRWHLENLVLITYIDIQNVYNRLPADVPRYDIRSGSVESEAAIGILPSIGISAEF